MSETVSAKGDLIPAKEVAIKEFNSLRGRLCTVIESAGLEKKQERAMIILIKNLSYQNQAVVVSLIEQLEEATEHQLQFRYIEEKIAHV